MKNLTRWISARFLVASFLLSAFALSQAGCLLAAAGAAGAGAGYVAGKSASDHHTKTTVEEVHEEHASSSDTSP